MCFSYVLKLSLENWSNRKQSASHHHRVVWNYKKYHQGRTYLIQFFPPNFSFWYLAKEVHHLILSQPKSWNWTIYWTFFFAKKAFFNDLFCSKSFSKWLIIGDKKELLILVCYFYGLFILTSYYLLTLLDRCFWELCIYSNVS